MGDGDIGKFNLSGGHIQFTYGSQAGQGTASVGVTLANFQTVMVSLGYTDAEIKNYLNHPGQPFLVTPKDSGTTFFDTTKFFHNLVTGQFSSTATAATHNKTYGEAFQERLNDLLSRPSILKDLGAENNADLADSKIKLALLFPENVTDPVVKKIIENLTKDFPTDWPGKEDLDGFLTEIGTRKDNSFEEQLGKLADPKDAKALQYAYYNNNQEGLTDAQKTMFKQIMDASRFDLVTNFGISPNIQVPSPGKEYFNTKLNLDLEDDFITKLSDLKVQGDLGLPGGITAKDFNILRSMLYFKDPSNPDQARLMGLFQSLYGQTLQQFKADGGLPPQWNPEPQTAAGQAFADGEWRKQFEINLNKQEITPELKNEIMLGLANPASASPIVQAMLNTLISQTTAEIIENLGLPSSWNPIAKVRDPNVSKVTQGMMQGGIKNLQDIYQAGLEALKAMAPGDPMRAVLMDYLKRIGDALNKLQETVYILESESAKAAKVLSSAMRDMQQNKMDQAAKQADQARQQRNSKGYKKSHDPGKQVFMKIFGPIMAIIMLLLSVICPVLFVLALFMLANSISQAVGGPDLMQKAFELISTVVDLLCKALGIPPNIASALKMIVKIMVIIYIVVIAIMIPGGGGIVGAMIIGQFLMDAIGKSGFVRDGMKATNPNVTDAELAKADQTLMIVTMVVMFTVMLVAMIAQLIITAGGAIIGVVAQIAKAALQVIKMLFELLKALIQFIVRLPSLIAQMAVKFIQAPLASIMNIVKVVAGALTEAAQFVKSLPKMIADTAKALWDGIKSAVQTVIDITSDFMDDAAQQTSQSIESAGNRITEIGKDISDKCDKLIKLVRSGEVIEALKSNFSIESIADDAASVTDELANVAIEGAEAAEKGSKGTGFAKLADYVVAAGSFAQGLQSTVTGITQAQYAMMMAALVLKQARSEAYMEEVDAMIKLLKKVITALLEGMAPFAEFISDISNLQSKKFQDSSSGAGWNAI